MAVVYWFQVGEHVAVSWWLHVGSGVSTGVIGVLCLRMSVSCSLLLSV